MCPFIKDWRPLIKSIDAQQHMYRELLGTLAGGGARRSSLLGKEGSEDDGGEGKLGGEGGEKGEESNP